MSPEQTELDRRVLERLLLAKRNFERRQGQIRDAIAAAFEATPGDPRFCVRRLDVARHVSGVLGLQILNNMFFTEVEVGAAALGFQAIRNGGRALYRCAKLRALDIEAALTMSRMNRRDARRGRADRRRHGSRPAVAPVPPVGPSGSP